MSRFRLIIVRLGITEVSIFASLLLMLRHLLNVIIAMSYVLIKSLPKLAHDALY